MDSINFQGFYTMIAPKVRSFTPYIIQSHCKSDVQEEKTCFNINESNLQMEEQCKIEVQDQKNLSDLVDQTDSHSQKLKRKRKNKNQKNKQIQTNNKDDGRGGNCIASNISKALLRIIYAALTGISYGKFKEVAQKYQIKSQKQNTVILINFLYLFSEQGLIETIQFEKIIFNFIAYLRDSKHNCQKRMLQQPQRAEFHKKNQRMYEKFIKLTESIAYPLIKKLKTKSDYTLSLMELEEIISDTYDRKQRQIQKAISKLKSIVLNYEELKNLYNYHSNRNVDSFFEAIEYAYRRNLPKRCKQIRSNIQFVLCSFLQIQQKVNEYEQFLIFYSVLDIISEKKDQIWTEFVHNVMLKIKYNISKQDQKTLQTRLIVSIPSYFQKWIRKNHSNEEQSTQLNLEQNSQSFQSTFLNETVQKESVAKMAYQYKLIKKDFHL